MKNLITVYFTLLITTIILGGKGTSLYESNYRNTDADTIQYYAKNFVIQPNDNLEDLLKRLPNTVIDKDGNIYAQGDTIKIILVDGEDFFGDAPMLTTRTIRADKVDKIQFYYKISDQATFTGVEDKIRIKVINVILKKNKKIGFLRKKMPLLITTNTQYAICWHSSKQHIS